jgi:hypothetical protein
MASVARFLTRKLRLTVNAAKVLWLAQQSGRS